MIWGHATYLQLLGPSHILGTAEATDFKFSAHIVTFQRKSTAYQCSYNTFVCKQQCIHNQRWCAYMYLFTLRILKVFGQERDHSVAGQCITLL